MPRHPFRPARVLTALLLPSAIAGLVGCPAQAPTFTPSGAAPAPSGGPAQTTTPPADTAAEVKLYPLPGVAEAGQAPLANADITVEDAVTNQPVPVFDFADKVPAGTMGVYRPTLKADAAGNFVVFVVNPQAGSLLRLRATSGDRAVLTLAMLGGAAAPAKRELLDLSCTAVPTVATNIKLTSSFPTSTQKTQEDFAKKVATDISTSLGISLTRVKINDIVAGYTVLAGCAGQTLSLNEVSTALTAVAQSVAKLAKSGLTGDQVGLAITDMIANLNTTTQQLETTFKSRPDLARAVTDAKSNKSIYDTTTTDASFFNSVKDSLKSVQDTVNKTVNKVVGTVAKENPSVLSSLQGEVFVGTNLKITITDGKIQVTDTATNTTVTLDTNTNTTTTTSGGGGTSGAVADTTTFRPSISALSYDTVSHKLTMTVVQPGGTKEIDVQSMTARILASSVTLADGGASSAYNPAGFPDPIATGPSTVKLDLANTTYNLGVTTANADGEASAAVSIPTEFKGGTLSNPDFSSYITVDPGGAGIKIARFQIYKNRSFDGGPWNVLALTYNTGSANTSHFGTTTKLTTTAFGNISAGAKADVVFYSRTGQVQPYLNQAITITP